MKSLIPLSAVAALLALSPFALACSCGTTGDCQCAGGCHCSSPSDTPDSTPTETNLAASLLDAGTANVNVTFDSSFDSNPTIFVGDTVQWTFQSTFHTVTSVAGLPESFDSGLVFQSGATFSHTFTHPGTYWYFCEIHGSDNGDGTASGMAAFVTVLPAPEPASLSILAAVPALSLLRRRPR